MTAWKLVPVEPTPEMLAACAPATHDASAEDYALAEKAINLLPPVQHPEATEIVAELARDYRNMLAAAPSPPSPPERSAPSVAWRRIESQQARRIAARDLPRWVVKPCAMAIAAAKRNLPDDDPEVERTHGAYFGQARACIDAYLFATSEPEFPTVDDGASPAPLRPAPYEPNPMSVEDAARAIDPEAFRGRHAVAMDHALTKAATILGGE